MSRLTFAVLLFCAITPLNFGQSVTVSNPQAQTIAAKSVAALTGGVTVSDVTLTGNVTAIAGSDTQTGTATLMATAKNTSRIDLNLGGGTRTDIQNGTSGVPFGGWSTNGGAAKTYATHNSWNDASWFFPAFTSLADPTGALSFIGLETRNGISVQHLRSSRSSSLMPLAQQWSAMNYYLDASTLLPVALSFNIHPDDNSSINIPVEVRFSNYQSFNGVQVPMHVQKFLNGGLALDLVVTNVAVNSGLPSTAFNIQ